MFVSTIVHILKQPLFLSSKTVLVSLARIAAEITVGIATVHGMMFGMPVGLFDLLIVKPQSVLSGNFDLTSNGYISFVAAPRINEFG
jgi:hypothetical protein